MAPSPQQESATPLASTPPDTLARALARETPIDPDLARLLDAWPALSPTVKRMILAALDVVESDQDGG